MVYEGMPSLRRIYRKCEKSKKDGVWNEGIRGD